MFADEIKYFFSGACIKEDNVLIFLIIGFIFDHIFRPIKDKIF